jgi:hypothetical protein
MRRLTSNISVITFNTIIAILTLSIDASFGQTGAQDNNNENHEYVTGITSARARSLVGTVIGLVSLVTALYTKAQTNKNAKKSRTWGNWALVLGIVAIVLSIIHLASTNGDFGTGGGKAGAIVGLALGFAGAGLGGYYKTRANGN